MGYRKRESHTVGGASARAFGGERKRARKTREVERGREKRESNATNGAMQQSMARDRDGP